MTENDVLKIIDEMKSICKTCKYFEAYTTDNESLRMYCKKLDVSNNGIILNCNDYKKIEVEIRWRKRQ